MSSRAGRQNIFFSPADRRLFDDMTADVMSPSLHACMFHPRRDRTITAYQPFIDADVAV